MLRRRVKYLENKISSESQTIDEVVDSLEFGQWQSTCLEHIPLITTYTIIQWVLEYPRQSGGYGFPFDRPHLDFYRRLQKAHQLLEKIMAGPLSSQIKDTKPFLHVYRKFKSVVEDKRLNALAGSLERKAEVFDKLRTAMRIALPENKKGLNDNGEDADMKSIEDKVTAFRKWIISDGRRKSTYAKMIEQVDKYWDKLFADPLPVVTPDGIMYIQPQRTNNILEQFFRGEKRRCRKKSGTASLNRVLKTALADTPLVQNLKNSEYMDIILNDCSSLAERFSKIDANLIQKEIENEKNKKERILPGVKKLIRDSDLIAKITALFSSNAK